jgi:hypothetical protein
LRNALAEHPWGTPLWGPLLWDPRWSNPLEEPLELTPLCEHYSGTPLWIPLGEHPLQDPHCRTPIAGSSLREPHFGTPYGWNPIVLPPLRDLHGGTTMRATLWDPQWDIPLGHPGGPPSLTLLWTTMRDALRNHPGGHTWVTPGGQLIGHHSVTVLGTLLGDAPT